jgi:hypothetical protein
MARTTVNSGGIRNGNVKREDCNISTTGEAVVTNLIEGDGITFDSSGVDDGTGEVKITNLPFGTRVTFSYYSNQLIYENDYLALYWVASNRQFAFVNKATGYYTYSVYTMYDSTRKRIVRSRNLNLNNVTYLSNNGNSQKNWGFPSNEENGSSTFMIAKDSEIDGVIKGEALRHFNYITVLIWRMS